MQKALAYLFFCSAALCPISAIYGDTETQTDLATIEAEIKEFTNARDAFAERAYIAGSRADQIMDEDWLGYRQALANQARFQQDVVWLNEKIAELEKQKQQLQAKLKTQGKSAP